MKSRINFAYNYKWGMGDVWNDEGPTDWLYTPLLFSCNLVSGDRSVQVTYSSVLKVKKVRSFETSSKLQGV
jgi:hypothetical protein